MGSFLGLGGWKESWILCHSWGKLCFISSELNQSSQVRSSVSGRIKGLAQGRQVQIPPWGLWQMKPRDKGMTSTDPVYHQKSDLIMKKCLATFLTNKNIWLHQRLFDMFFVYVKWVHEFAQDAYDWARRYLEMNKYSYLLLKPQNWDTSHQQPGATLNQ